MNKEIITKEIEEVLINKLPNVIAEEKDEAVRAELQQEMALQTIRALVCNFSGSADTDKAEEAVTNIFKVFVDEVCRINEVL